MCRCRWGFQDRIVSTVIAILSSLDSNIFLSVPVTSDTVMKTFTVPETSAPLWFYCGQTGHCAAGMVFAINPPADPAPNSFSAFKALAMSQGTSSASAPVAGPSSTPTASSSAYVTPPPPHWQSATATVTWGGSTYTTTYSSYDGTPRTFVFYILVTAF
jgi:hypothetical protein